MRLSRTEKDIIFVALDLYYETLETMIEDAASGMDGINVNEVQTEMIIMQQIRNKL